MRHGWILLVITASSIAATPHGGFKFFVGRPAPRPWHGCCPSLAGRGNTVYSQSWSRGSLATVKRIKQATVRSALCYQ